MKPGKIHLQNQFLQHLRLTNPSPKKRWTKIMSFFVLLKGSVVFFFWDEFLKIIFLILVELTNISSRERIHIPPWFLRSHLFFQTSFQGDSFWRISSTIKGTASIPLRFIDFLIEAAMAHSIPLPAVSQGFDGSYSCLRVKLIGWNCLGTENRCCFFIGFTSTTATCQFSYTNTLPKVE